MVIGITGSIASGKSLVTNYLRTKGYKVIDSDKIAHSILDMPTVKAQIYETFAVDNRAALSKIVFNDKAQLEKLNAIMKPLIIDKLKKEMQKRHEKIYFVDAPVLYEMNLQYMFDKVLVVYVDKEAQIVRLMRRDLISREYAIKKISMQIDIESKKELSDFVIDNSQDKDMTYKQIDEILRRLLNEI
ncbi:MAG: dephospho-CoA kinase [Bacilli bacterium]